MKYRIGTSGWYYRHWLGDFYPASLPRANWLSYYSATFDTVELNASFYRLPAESAFVGWRRSVSEGFSFAVKASRVITHVRRLKNVDEELRRFLDRVGLLQERLGPVLYQLPPGLRRDLGLLEEFLALLPRDIRHAFEFRNREWFDDAVFDLMRRYNACFCLFDMPGLTTPVVTTADFAYIRFHGHTVLYYSDYSDEELGIWAENIKQLKGVGEVYIYFNNDAGGHAVKNALSLKRMLR